MLVIWAIIFNFSSVFENLQIQTLLLFFERWRKKEWLQRLTFVFREKLWLFLLLLFLQRLEHILFWDKT